MKRRKINRVFGTFGIWKTTIVRHLLSQEDLNLEFSISAASRESRGEEANGKDYYLFQLKNSNNTSRMTTFWNGKKFTETISTEL
jgi:guanylate kinase